MLEFIVLGQIPGTNIYLSFITVSIITVFVCLVSLWLIHKGHAGEHPIRNVLVHVGHNTFAVKLQLLEKKALFVVQTRVLPQLAKTLAEARERAASTVAK